MSNIIGVRNNNTIVPLSAGSTMPAGTIIAYSGSIAAFSTITSDGTTLYYKDGWAVCNGASLSQTTFSQLYARIAATWDTTTNPLTGSAQSSPASGYFRIPNLQGTFLRGVADYSGVDAYSTDNDVTLGAYKVDQTQGHKHTDGGHVHNNTNKGSDSTSGQTSSNNRSVGGQNNSISLQDTGYGYAVISAPSTDGTNGTPRTGKETSPKQVGVYYLVKLYDNLAAVDVYIPPASAGILGLVNNTAGNTAGTPILGKTDGVSVASGYVGEKITWVTPPSTQSLTTSIADWTNAYITLPKGSWQLFAGICLSYFTGTTAGADGFAYCCITDSSNNIINDLDDIISVGYAVAGQTLYNRGLISFTTIVDVTSDNTVYKIRVRRSDNSGTGSGSVENNTNVKSRFFAIRKA